MMRTLLLRIRPLLLACFAACAAAAPAHAAIGQARRPAQARLNAEVSVEVSDALGGVLPGATATLVGPDPIAEAREAVADSTGRAVFSGLPPGRYSLRVALGGFETASLDDVVVRAGAASRHAVELRIQGYEEAVTVTQDPTGRRLADNFSETLSAEEIDQLPDDPEEAAALIAELAGADAEIRVNGFEGGQLPPKSQIQVIRIRQDPFSADARGAGRPRVDIITRPGSSGWRHDFNAGLRDQSIDARNAFAETRGEGQTRRLRWSSSGPIVRNRTSLSLSLSARNAFDLEPIVATRPGGAIPAGGSQQNRGLNADVRVEHALTDTHVLRVEYQRRSGERHNLGIGGFDLPERAYDAEDEAHRFRISDVGTFGKRIFNELRLQVAAESDEQRSRSQAVTIDVDNAFTAGGAQRSGGTRAYELEIENDLELALNDRHKIRVGLDAEYVRLRSDRSENAAGRFIFPSADAFDAGRPIQFVQRVGDPALSYSGYELSWYVSDDVRLHKRLQIGLGLRHDVQSFVGDWANFAPRASVSWTPPSMGETTIRAGAGFFTDSYSFGLHEQTLRLDGTRQRDLIVSDPGWPDAFSGAGGIDMPRPAIVTASGELRLPTTRRLSLGAERELTEAIEIGVNLFDEITSDRLRSLDVNAPVDGVRPDPGFSRITEIRSTGRGEERGVELNLRARGRALFGNLRYRWARELNDGDGALSLPVDGANPDAEWGPASNDVRHRLFGYMRLRLPYGLGLGVNARVSSGAPYTVRTGFDDNGDEVTNDRPPGVGRNTERGEWHTSTDLRFGWTVAGSSFGGGRGDGGRDGGGRDGRRERDGGGRSRNDGGAGERGAEIYTQITNLFNTTNFSRYSGVLTSRYFGLPTAAQSGRRMELGLRIFF